MPLLLIIGLVFSFGFNEKATMDFISNKTQVNEPSSIVTSLNKEETQKVSAYLIALEGEAAAESSSDLENLLSKHAEDEAKYAKVVAGLPISDANKYESGFKLFKHKIPMWIFLVSLILLSVWAYKENLSLIPLLGLICCLYMMAELSVWNWIYFGVWLLIGLVIYFSFSRKNSKFNLVTQ
jgi:hypothetical protein